MGGGPIWEYHMNLRELSDDAVGLYFADVGKCSAKQAVQRACAGKGLNKEQMARVSGMTNRAILQRTKTAAAGSVPERFDTAKADKVVEWSMDVPPGTTTEDLLAAHQEGTEQLTLRHQGEVEVGGDPPEPIRSSVTGSEGKAPSAAGAATLAEVRAMIRTPGKPEMSEQGGDLERKVSSLRRSIGLPEPTRVEKVSSAPDTFDVIEDLTFRARGAHHQMDGRIFEAELAETEAFTELGAAVARLEKSSGFTLGELLGVVQAGIESVQTPSSNDAAVEAFGYAFKASGLDPEAAAGAARSSNGQLKTSSIEAARARLEVRPGVLDSVDPHSPLYKLAARCGELFETTAVLRKAKDDLAAAALRGHEALGDFRAQA